MDNKIDSYITYSATTVTVISNILMIVLLGKSSPIINILIICFAVFAQYHIYLLNKRKMSIRKFFPERWGIFGLAGVCLVWLSNRIRSINVPNELNWITVGIAGFISMFLLVILVRRLISK